MSNLKRPRSELPALPTSAQASHPCCNPRFHVFDLPKSSGQAFFRFPMVAEIVSQHLGGHRGQAIIGPYETVLNKQHRISSKAGTTDPWNLLMNWDDKPVKSTNLSVFLLHPVPVRKKRMDMKVFHHVWKKWKVKKYESEKNCSSVWFGGWLESTMIESHQFITINPCRSGSKVHELGLGASAGSLAWVNCASVQSQRFESSIIRPWVVQIGCAVPFFCVGNLISPW